MSREPFLNNNGNSEEPLRKFAEQITGWNIKNTHIKKIKIHAFSNRIHRIIDSDICVGKEMITEFSDAPHHEQVEAIFESDKFIVVTPDQIKTNKRIYLFDEAEVIGIEKDE